MIILTFLLMPLAHSEKQNPAYLIYNSSGQEVNWQKMINSLPGADIVFFGELHNDPISHWLELRVMETLYLEKKGKIIAGAEMFETDQQLILDEYLAKKIDDKRFEEGTKLWNNYTTDYKPLVRFAADSGIDFIATNIPRRYASMVSKGGFESLHGLSEEAKELFMPLPVNYDPDLPGYQKMMDMMTGHGEPDENFPKAQAVKDATMAFFILQNMNPKFTFLHFNGAYHSDFHDGIIWHLLSNKPDLKVMTISTVSQENIFKLDEENLKRADFIIVVPEDMTKTY